MDSIIYEPVFLKKLDVIGFNMSIKPTEDGYIGLTREFILTQKVNHIHFVKLDKDFNTISQTKLIDITGRKKYPSWTSGLEDPRIISEKHFLAVTCDSNDRWKPEMSFVDMDLSSNTITRIHPMSLCNQQHLPQKNWLVIRKEDEEYYDMLYEPEPFCVIRVNKETGHGFYLKEHRMLNKYIETRINSAAIMELEDGYLLLIRVKNDNGTVYHYSRWVKLDKEYNVQGVSPQFRFMNEYNGINYINEDGTFKSGNFEICMSLHQENEYVVACTSIFDKDVYIYKYKLDDIISSLKNE